MESLVSCGNVHNGLRKGQEPGSIVSYCASPILCICPGLVPVQGGEYAISLLVVSRWALGNWRQVFSYI